MFIVFTAPFAVVNAIPAFVGALTWPLVSLLFTFAYANAVAEVDGAEAGIGVAARG